MPSKPPEPAPQRRVIRGADDITADWLSRALGQPVLQFSARSEASNWSSQIPLTVRLADGGSLAHLRAAHAGMSPSGGPAVSCALRLKVCLGSTFGRSEVDYYTRDYVGLANAPLVRCHDAAYEAGVGYHLLLDDLAATHHDRRDVPPTLAYGLAVAEALGRMHRHHWASQPAPDPAALDRYFAEIRPGIEVIEHLTGRRFRARFEAHEQAQRARWADPRGMSLLHGDLNATNILTPKVAQAPVIFLDRQPFDWSLTYGVAAHDLAYFLVLSWPPQLRQRCEEALLRCWHEALGQPGYSWSEAQADWALAVEQCLHVPFEWCSKPDTVTRMRWLWQAQLSRVQAALDCRP